MAGSVSMVDRTRLRRWVSNWRTVNEVQDELTRAMAPPDPAACLERGLSLIAFTRHARTASPDAMRDREAGAQAVRQTWRRLRAAHGR